METAGSKGKRAIIFGVFAVLAVLVVIPASAAAGNLIASTHNNSQILQSDSTITSAYGMNGSEVIGLPLASFANNTTISSLVIGNTTVQEQGANNTTVNVTEPLYASTLYLENNVTVNELNAYDVSRIVLQIDVNQTVNETLGFGNNVSSFEPESYVQGTNGSSVSFSIQPQMTTVNSTHHVMFEITNLTNVTSLTVSVQTYGVTSLGILGPASGRTIGYIIGIVLVVPLSVLAMPWVDIERGDRH